MQNQPTIDLSRRQAIKRIGAGFAALALLPALPALASDGKLDEAVRLKHFNLGKNKLALTGYDPVSYHAGKPKKGSSKRALRFKGVIYRFASEANKQTFLKDPAKYEPAYGGWCAWAMREGSKTEIDPKSYLVINDRLYVFYKGFWGDTRKDWKALAKKQTNAALIKQADKSWKKFVG
ncbi:MAG: hypothetical protein KTR15_15205 [Phycisphaeraceae bacterium]|nr:hypothetical protein [Phycisphaeraceae bacterium]